MNSLSKKLRGQLSTPVLASIMRNRTEAIVLSGIIFAQGAAVLAGLPGWPCPVRHLLGIPCPGCGLTRATSALVQGQWQTSLSFHAFAPLILLGVVLIALSSMMPERSRRLFIDAIEAVETRSGLSLIVLSGLMLYWLIRLLFFPETSALLVGR